MVGLFENILEESGTEFNAHVGKWQSTPKEKNAAHGERRKGTPVNEKDLRNLANSPRFIPGIYNYCDRWCERCTFTARCRTFAMSSLESPEDENPAIEMEDFLSEMERQLSTTEEEREKIDNLIEAMNEATQNISDEEMEEFKAEHDRRQREAAEHPLAKNSRLYYQLVDEWIASMKSAWREKNIDLESEASRDKPNVETEEGKILDALQIVLWYQHFIYVKLMRALTSREDERDEEPEMAEFPKDSDGSVKIAMIAMERSIEAWNVLPKYFPSETKVISTMTQVLSILLEDTEARFPNARKFVRPGFDQEV